MILQNSLPANFVLSILAQCELVDACPAREGVGCPRFAFNVGPGVAVSWYPSDSLRYERVAGVDL